MTMNHRQVSTATVDSTTTTTPSCTTTTTTSTNSEKDENENHDDLTMIKVLWRTMQRQGLVGLYQGLGPELTRGIFSAALMLMIKERVTGTVQKLLQTTNSKTSNKTS
jgi:Mitochondrial carrier protein